LEIIIGEESTFLLLVTSITKKKPISWEFLCYIVMHLLHNGYLNMLEVFYSGSSYIDRSPKHKALD